MVSNRLACNRPSVAICRRSLLQRNGLSLKLFLKPLLVVLLAPMAAFAVGTHFWTTATYEDFSRGALHGVSLGREGSMSLSPELTEVFDTQQAMIWAVTEDSRGNVYLGTGHSGKVYRLDRNWKGEVVFDGDEPDVFALAVDKNNRLYVGTSPDGKVYRVNSDGKSTEFFDPKSKYIWSMAFAPDGDLYVGTGDRGRIYRVHPDGTGEMFYDTNQTHIMSLAINSQGELIAGTEPNGLLYKISSSGKGFVIYDSPMPEIHQLALGPDGSVYAAVLGGSASRQSRPLSVPPSAPAGSMRSASSITVRAADDPLQLPSPSGSPETPDQSGEESTPAPVVPVLPLPRVGGSRTQQNGALRSAIVRVHPDGTVETLWSSSSESAFDLVPSARRLLFSTDENGRIYQLVNGRELSLLTQTDQEQTTRLVPMGDSVLVTTANLGKVYRMGTEPAATGSFESEVRDAGNIAGWGHIRWQAGLPAGTSLELYTRSGNSERPDNTWSDWSAAYKTPDGEPIQSPPARYIQWKAVFHSAGNQSPVLQEVTLAYLPRNRAPEITEVRVASRAEQAGGSGSSSAASGASAASPGGRSYLGVSSAAHSNAEPGINISWQASDPDGDELTYALYFRGEGQTEWKLLQDDLRQNYFQLGPDSLPDGNYRIRVVASDAADNPPATALTAERISAPFVMDSTPPLVEVLSVARTGAGATVRFRAHDAASVLTRAEYAVDAGALQQMLSDDGIVDSQQETFTVQLASVDSQEHLITLRVYDFSGNEGIGKAVLPPLLSENGKSAAPADAAR